ALDGYIAAAAPELLRAQLGPGAPILATLFPTLPLRLAAAASVFPLPPEQERFRLYEAVAAFMAAIAVAPSTGGKAGALVLALDDLQWADAATFDLLVHIARRFPSAPVLVLGGYRDGEAEDN